ncbi:MAG: DUF2029 domain-containing protein [Gemmatales bacterium]|nr:DUF2029 domain-containing protein [Gemmatales bacterium]
MVTKKDWHELPAVVQVLLVVALVFALARYSVEGFALEIAGRSITRGWDLQTYYIAGEMLRSGENIYDHESARERAKQHPSLVVKDVAPYIYPPFFAIAMTPLSYLPFPWAYRVWVFCQQVFLAVALYFLAKSLPELGGWSWPLLIMLAANMWPVYQTIDIGQVNILMLLILCLTLYFARTGRFFWAGTVLGIGAMIKISPLLLMGLFVLQRRWSAIVSLFLTVTVLTLLSLVIVGPENMLAFASIDDRISTQVGWMHNLSPTALFHRVLPALGVASLEWPASVGVSFTVLTIVGAFSLRSYPYRDLAFALLFALWTTTMHLVSPVTWEHHFVMLLLAMGTSAAAIVSTWERSSLCLSLGFACVYVLLSFEHLVYTRIGQWWQFSGSYFHDYFFADLRLLGLISLFTLQVILFRRTQEKSSQTHTNAVV